MGGENRSFIRKTDASAGSSPRGRGKPDQQRRGLDPRRLIPAWAGKTRSFIRKADASAAHPRVGGENRAA